MIKKISTTALLIMALMACTRAQQLDSATEVKAIKQLVTNYEEAWNRHDSKGLASQYTENATWVNWFGAYYKGRADIEKHYATVHNSYFKSSRYYTRAVEDVTLIKPDVAIAHVRTGLTGDERYTGQTFEFRRTILLTRNDGQWRILAGQNAKLVDSLK
ncbi:MAG: hypothetical protein C0523_08600 [Cytophaga sp.]|nr:hypothetical protein [Cytophaga sp.]